MNKRVLINGACGRMGQEVVKTVYNDTDDLLIGACDIIHTGEDILSLLGIKGPEITIYDDLIKAIKETEPDIIIDFTNPGVVMNNIEIGLSSGIDMIVGTTGITEIDLKKIDQLCKDNETSALIVPN